MARAKRRFTTFNLSFLDIMSCGFGAIVLVFLIIDHSLQVEVDAINSQLLSEVSLLEQDIRDGEADLVAAKNTVATLDLEIVEAQGQAARVQEEVNRIETLLDTLNNDELDQNSVVASLTAELKQLEAEIQRLQALADANAGRSARDFSGEGNRQYLTGLNLGGQRIVILLDTSASMLDDRIVNIIQLRNRSPELQAQSRKWRRSVNTVRWLLAQLPPSAQYQVIIFNTAASSALPDTQGQWLDVANQAELDRVADTISGLLPSGGSSLHAAFRALAQLSPQTDNIFLITDGLPTQGDKQATNPRISGRDREALFQSAIGLLPRNVPVNTILAPMEGYPMAPAYFWQLAQSTRGSFISPSKDWP